MDDEIHALDTDGSGPTPSPHYRMRFTPGPHSARHVRRIVRSQVTAWGMPQLVERAELGVTELVANVVRHVPGTACTVLMLRQADGVRVEVHDGDPALPVPRRAGVWEESGRGLQLLAECADLWDAERTGPATKAVWFELKAGE